MEYYVQLEIVTDYVYTLYYILIKHKCLAPRVIKGFNI